MNKIKNILFIATIILLLIGAWPFAIPTAIIALIVQVLKGRTGETTAEDIKSIKKENEALRAELAEQAVRRAMDHAESREKKG